MKNNINKSIENLAELRIEIAKLGSKKVEQMAFEIEMNLCKVIDYIESYTDKDEVHLREFVAENINPHETDPIQIFAELLSKWIQKIEDLNKT